MFVAITGNIKTGSDHESGRFLLDGETDGINARGDNRTKVQVVEARVKILSECRSYRFCFLARCSAGHGIIQHALYVKTRCCSNIDNNNNN